MIRCSNFFYTRIYYFDGLETCNLLLNKNIQEFSEQVDYIAQLQSNGKLSSKEAFEEIDALWQNLKHRKKDTRNWSIIRLFIKLKK